MASYGGLKGILTGLTKSTDHPSKGAPPSKQSSKKGLILYEAALEARAPLEGLC